MRYYIITYRSSNGEHNLDDLNSPHSQTTSLTIPNNMVPRFFRTFLVIAILLFVPTTYLVYTQTSYSHPTSTTSFSSSGGNIEDDLLSREDHWDKGGSYPGALRVKESDLDELGGMYSSSRIKSNDSDDDKVLSEEMMINGKIIMPKLSNATAK
jgi:hypothetical protein